MTLSPGISDINMEISIGTRADIPRIASLERDIFSGPWREEALELFFGGDGFCIVCREGDEMLGYCTVLTVLDEMQIINVATDSRHRRRGIASLVVRAVLEEGRSRGLRSASLEVRESNLAAISLYTELGFESVGIRRNFYKEPRENALVMIRKTD